jgi:hypothetical protein
MNFRMMIAAGCLIVAPAAFTSSFAQSSGGGSDIPKATTRAAFPGPAIKGGKAVSSTLSPTSGTGGGGMSSGGGVKPGGEDRKSKIPDSAP